MNLGVNARDAMPDGGVLSLSIRRVVLAQGAEADGLHGDFLVLELTDTGAGIPPETLPRVFDPFFTTKGVGKGTGLGLSPVYGFARQSGGTATIRSRPGHGTTVSIYLPATDAPTDVAQDPPAIAGAARARRGTVLVVEDSNEVAAVSADYFEQLGYSVEHAANGSDALRQLGSRPYSLVFSDILMPGSIAGLELARIVREHHAETPVLLVTGYSDKAQEAVHEGFPVIRKPYDLHGLSNAIRELRPREQARAAD